MLVASPSPRLPPILVTHFDCFRSTLHRPLHALRLGDANPARTVPATQPPALALRIAGAARRLGYLVVYGSHAVTPLFFESVRQRNFCDMYTFTYARSAALALRSSPNALRRTAQRRARGSA